MWKNSIIQLLANAVLGWFSKNWVGCQGMGLVVKDCGQGMWIVVTECG